MKKMLAVLLLAAALPAHAQRNRWTPILPPWKDLDVVAVMRGLGWQFTTSLGAPEHKCYALPPGKRWPEGEWVDQSTRDAAVAAGAKRFEPRADGSCYAADVPHDAPP